MEKIECKGERIFVGEGYYDKHCGAANTANNKYSILTL